MDKETFTAIWPIVLARIYCDLRHMEDPIREGLDMKSDTYKALVKNMHYIALVMDGHSTHIYDHALNKNALYHRIVIINYIPHTTHVCQPLDQGINTKIKVLL